MTTISSHPSVTTDDVTVQVSAERQAVERLRLMLVVLCLTLAVFAQSAGNTATDTKIDLVVSPLRFLGRALRLWDPIGDAGQLQNQSYGYLFPMGPFFAGLHGLGIAEWEIQRAWESAIIVAAFLGTYLVARRLVIDSFWPAVAAGLTYAFAPRVLGELTSISSELMPVAALPWILLPLISGATHGSPRRAAARSGVALLFAGGVNAAATLAVLPVPALWLLTRSRGPRRRALIGWWSLAIVLACSWWAVPLLQLGRYSPPFLDWIESSSTTTLPTSLLATLRGVDHWESYLGPNIWPAGWILASAPIAVVATTAVAGAGLMGLGRRDVPNRVFLWSSLLLGLVLVTAGHAAPVGPPGSGWMRMMLDGVLVPFRNIHKFDPVVRLPIALGVGYLLSRARIPREVLLGTARKRLRVPARFLSAAAVVAAGLIAVSPVLTNHLVSSQRISTEPSWWRSAAAWLGEHSGGARALVVPGSASPQYLWGGTVDNALQAVATTPWTGRNAVPLTQAGYVRLLNQIETKMSAGAADPTLAPLLARAGIGYVVLANDLNTLTSASTPLLYVRTTLDDSPGIELQANIGPKVGGTLSPTVLLDSGATVQQPAVQIYGVTGWGGVAALQPLTGAVEATGSTDALAQLLARGLPQQTPVLFGSDAGGVPVVNPLQVTTDGIRRREASFAGVLTSSVTLTAGGPYSTQRPVHDYLPDKPGPLSALHYTGIENVSASSAGDGPLAYINRGDLKGAWSALDGDPSTSWKSSGFSGAVGQWLEVTFAGEVSASSVELSFGQVDSALPTSVVVRTDAGTVVDEVTPDTAPQAIRVHPGATHTLRITIGSVADGSRGVSAAISTLSIPGVNPSRTLRVPSEPAPAVLAFDVADGYRNTCLDVAGIAICDPDYARSGQEDASLDRSFDISSAGSYTPRASVRLVGGPRLDSLLDSGSAITATASSVNSDDPRQRPGSAVDGDPMTTWQAAAGDAQPSLTLHLGTQRSVTGIRVLTQPSSPVAGPVRVTVAAGDQTWTGSLPAGGHIVFPAPVRTDTITITVDESSLRPTTNSASLTTRLLAVGIGEVTVDGYPTPVPGAADVSIGCRSGLALSIDGNRVPLRVTASRTAVLAGSPVTAEACDDRPLELAPGAHRVSMDAVPQASPVAATLTRVGVDLSTPAPSAGTMAVQSWGTTSRRVRVDTIASSVLVVHENANAGWQASLHGRQLQSVRVDGWEQAFVVPAGTHAIVQLAFAPQRPFVLGLVGGAVAAIILLLLAVVGRGRIDRPALRPATGYPWLGAAGVTTAFALLGGWAAVLTFATVAAAAGLIVRSRFALPSWVCGLLLVTAAVSVARGQRVLIFAHQNASLIQLLCIAALASAVLAAASLPRQGRDP